MGIQRRRIAIILVALCATSPSQSPSSSGNEAEDLVAKWIKGPRSERSANTILDDLRNLPISRTEEAIRKALKSPDDRISAIQLTRRMRHPRALTLLKDYIKDENCGAYAIAALLACEDAATERALRQMWMSEKPDSYFFQSLNETWRKRRLGTQTIEFFLKQAKQSVSRPHAEEARKIAAASLMVASNSDQASLDKAWRAYNAKCKLRGKPWAPPLDSSPIEYKGGLRWDGNRELGDETSEYLRVPSWAGTEDHTLVINFMPLSDDGVEVGYGSTAGLWSIRIKSERKGKGVIIAGDQTEYLADIALDDWNTFRFEIDVEDIPGVFEKSRTIQMWVNERKIGRYFTLNGDLEGLYVGGHCVIGGCYARKAID